MALGQSVAGTEASSRPRIVSVLAVLAVSAPWLLFGASSMADEGAVILPADDPPPALEALGNLDIAGAVAIGYDGRIAAVGAPDPLKPKHGIVRVFTGDETAVNDVRIKGRVVALSFDRWGETLFALGHRVGRKGVLDAFVDRIDLATMKPVRLVTLPASAMDMDLWIHGSSLLIACENEIRTVGLPQGRSGPLYRVLGDNLAVASLPGSDRVLLGQTDRIVLVDLSDPQGRDAMPTRGTLDVPAPVKAFAAAPSGEKSLLKLDDDRVYTLNIDPFELTAAGSGRIIAWPGEPVAYEPPPPPVPAPEPGVVAEVSSADTTTPVPAPMVESPASESETEMVPTVVEDSPRPEPEPEPLSTAVVEESPPPEPEVRTPEPGAAAAAVVAAETVTVAEPQPTTTDQPSPAPAQEPTPTEPAPSPEGTAPETVPQPAAAAESTASADPTKGDAEGRLTGPAVAKVVAVVLLGPDNILREAERARPDSEGRWTVFGLAPGRYRVIVDGGGGRVLQSEPAFRTIDVESGTRVRVDSIKVIGAL